MLNTKMITKINEMEIMEKKLLIIEFNKGGQLDRSFGKNITTPMNTRHIQITGPARIHGSDH